MDGKQAHYFLPYSRLQALLDSLSEAGYDCIGPQLRDDAIVYDKLHSAKQLPWGMRDHQSPGEYRLEKIPENKAFAFANGPQAIKPLLFKPQETVWKVTRDQSGKIEFKPHQANEKPMAIFGARACDIAGMVIQDKVFIDNPRPEPRYKSRRENLLIIGVNCTYSSENCFCVSAGTGPDIKHNFDVVMTEVQDGFVIASGSEKGKAIIDGLKLVLGKEEQHQEAVKNIKFAADKQTKRIPFNNSSALNELLFNNLYHPRWDEVADRCLSCGNCTSVCPTCFCHSEIEEPALDGQSSEHVKEWDSCFTAGHSNLNGHVLRDDTKKRYRQWLTHKVGSWFDQFGTSGCVGCGRCVSWCPVGIDLTEELAAISGESNKRESDD